MKKDHNGLMRSLVFTCAESTPLMQRNESDERVISCKQHCSIIEHMFLNFAGALFSECPQKHLDRNRLANLCKTNTSLYQNVQIHVNHRGTAAPAVMDVILDKLAFIQAVRKIAVPVICKNLGV
jgi:hypothetical protein